MRIGLPHAGRGHPPRAGPAPAVPPLVAGEPRGGRKRRLPLGFVRAGTAAAYRPTGRGRGPWVVGHRAASGIPSVDGRGPFERGLAADEGAPKPDTQTINRRNSTITTERSSGRASGLQRFQDSALLILHPPYHGRTMVSRQGDIITSLCRRQIPYPLDHGIPFPVFALTQPPPAPAAHTSPPT